MGKTLEIARDRAFDESKTVLPVEMARGVYVENPPSAAALKLMHLLIAKAGGRMADEVHHELRMADIKAVDGMRNHDRATLRALFTQLRAATLVYDDTKTQTEIIGGFMDEIRIDYRHEVSDDLLIKWWFGRTFRHLAAESNHWAILDRQTIFALSSKYAILLFQHIASFANYEHIARKTFTVPELRAILGVPEGKIKRFANLKKDVLDLAIAEINQTSRLVLTATPKKIGRTVAAIEIAWREKDHDQKQETKHELAVSKVGRKARRDGAAEMMVRTFPASGSIAYTQWGDVARQELPQPRRDLDLVAERFRNWCNTKPIPLDAHNIEAIFRKFCQREEPAR
jgi:hypothetical protein